MKPKDKTYHPTEIPVVTAHQYPYKFRESMIDDTRRLARFGCTNEEIAEWLKISLQTFAVYQHDIPEFMRALEDGRMFDSMKVVDSLHKQALGYVVQEHEVAEHVTRSGDIIELKKTTTKFVNPSVTAAIYLLKTRHGDKWMDIVKTESTRNLNIMVKNVDFSDMTDDELVMLKKIGIKSIPQEFGRHNLSLPEKSEHQMERTAPMKPRGKSIYIQDVRGN